MTDDEVATFFTVTLLRNPWDRLVSYWAWLRAQRFDHPAVALARGLEFSAFLNHPQTQTALRAWPVPVTGGELRFDRVVSGEVFAADGRQVLRAQRTAVLDVAALQPGTYTLRCIDGARVVFVK